MADEDLPEAQWLVAANLRRLRKGYRDPKTDKPTPLSQEDLGALADIHRTYVGFVERGERKISVNVLFKIAGGLGVDVRELLRPPAEWPEDQRNEELVECYQRLLER